MEEIRKTDQKTKKGTFVPFLVLQVFRRYWSF